MSKFDLKRAVRRRALVRIHRRFETRALTGFAVASGEWLLLHILHRELFVLNGYTAVRVRDIDEASAEPGPLDGIAARVVRLKRLKPKPQPKISMASAAQLIRSVGRQFPLLTIHREGADQDLYWVGAPLAVSPEVAEFKMIDHTARWMPGVPAFKLATITRVDFGREYESMLHRLNETV